MHIEVQPHWVDLCDGECVDISVTPFGGDPPYSFSWSHKLSPTSGPHRVCPENDTTYAVTVSDTGLDSEEFSIASDQVQGRIAVVVSHMCVNATSPDAGADSEILDSSDGRDTGYIEDSGDTTKDTSDGGIAGNIEDPGDTVTDTDASTPVETCSSNCPDLQWVELLARRTRLRKIRTRFSTGLGLIANLRAAADPICIYDAVAVLSKNRTKVCYLVDS